jgi:3-oxoacyl-[acyl-carrier-protein] synthase III
MLNILIKGSGSYIPEIEVENLSFTEHPFFFSNGKKVQSSNEEVIEKFQEITGIYARRYVKPDQTCSQIATIAAEKAITSSNIDPETIDMIIVAQNFGDFMDKIGPDISSVSKILLDQANEKMDVAIVKRLFRAFGQMKYRKMFYQ